MPIVFRTNYSKRDLLEARYDLRSSDNKGFSYPALLMSPACQSAFEALSFSLAAAPKDAEIPRECGCLRVCRKDADGKDLTQEYGP